MFDQINSAWESIYLFIYLKKNLNSNLYNMYIISLSQ